MEHRIRQVAVLGCGLMGSGIAEVCARAGYDTHVREINDAFAEKGRGAIVKSLGRAVDKGKMTAEDREAALQRVRMTTRLEDLRSADLVIEAVTENLEMKNEMFRTLDEICPETTLFASNTSSLTIAAMAAATSRPDRFVGLHFFNPVPVMKLVEVVRSIATSPATFQTAMSFARSLGKEPVEARDTSGFIVNRLLVPYMLDAIRGLEQGLASIEDIDRSMTLGTGYPMGPFTLCDFVGIDTLHSIAEIMFEEFREPRFAPPPLLKRMVTLGYHGRKTRKGFYDYTTDTPTPLNLGV
ncbi:MAG: 3-hydroxyacyl-CoA dehydrogenase NAD-binding domain-containing protein [Gemmatimonadetes bacterium]|nr:3-hydroxyacyl-CoA dehydrogenase NAD-binding domain-containing protein [Gemmatimonadota bacterium]